MHAEAVLLVDHGQRRDRRTRHPPAPAHACRPRAGSCRRRGPPASPSSARWPSRPVSSASRTPAASASGAMVAKCWRARSSVGAISAACAPASTAVSMARRRPASCRCRHRPAAAAPCARAWPCRPRSRPMAKVWLGVSWKGRAASACFCRAPSPLVAAAGERAVVMAHQRDRELAGQQLVEGEPAPAPDASATSSLPRPVHAPRRARVFQPDHLCCAQVRRVLPFRQLRRALDGGGDRLLQRPLGQAGGQAIDRRGDAEDAQKGTGRGKLRM